MRERSFLLHKRLTNYFSGPRRTAALAALLAMVLLIAGWWGAHLWYRERLLAEKRAEITAEVAPYGSALIRAIDRRIGLLRGLKAFVETHASAPTFADEVQTFMAGLHAGTTGIRNLAVAPGGVNRYVYPLAGNEAALGHDLLHDPRPNVRADVERAIRSRQIALSGPYELRQSGLGLVARQAVYQGKAFWGLVTMVLDVPPILEEANLHQYPGALNLALRDGSGQIFFGDGALFTNDPVIQRINLPEGFWELAAIPSVGWDAAIRQAVRLFDIAAFMIVSLLTVIVYLLVNRDARLALNVQRRTEEITRINAQLERELAERKRLEEELLKANEELERKVGDRTANLEDANNALQVEIRARKQIEEALRESERRFHGIFDQTYQFVGLLRPDGMLLEANRTALDFRGLKRSEVVGRPFWKTPWWDISKETQDRLKAAIKDASQGLFVRHEVDLLDPDGTVNTFDFSLKPVTDESGQVVLLIPEGRNITDRKRAEQALQENEALLRAIIDNSTRVIYLKDKQGRYILVNRQYEELFHIRRDQIKGKTDYDLFPKDMADRFRANDLMVLEAGTPMELEEVAPHDDGIHTYISNKFPMVDSAGVPYAVCGISTDITGRKRMEDELRRARDQLEMRVQERTAELVKLNEALRADNLERERVEEELALRNRQLVTLSKISEIALNTQSLDAAFQEIVDEISSATSFPMVVIELYDEARQMMVFKGIKGIPSISNERVFEVPLGQTLSGAVARSGLPLVETNAWERPEYADTVLRQLGTRTFVCVPMRGSQKIIGVLSLASSEVISVDDGFIQMTTELANHVAALIERKRTETWLQSLIETTQDAVISIDRQGRIVLFNPAAEQIFGYTRTEVEGKRVNILMAEPYTSEHDSYVRRYEQTGERRAIGQIRTVSARRKNGEIFPIELSVTEVSTGDEVRYAAFIRDISEKARLQGQVVESERLAAIGATSATLAHEIANPLNGMSMTIQLLERRLTGIGSNMDERIQSALRSLKHEISRLTLLLQDFSSLSRRETYNFQPVALVTVVGELFAMEKESYRTRGIQVEQSFPPGLPLVFADRDKLKQALLNLCKNAVEAMPDGGRLTLTGYNSGEQVVLEIRDSGVGIPAGVDIFEPFTTTKAAGTGLGLVIVRQIVAAHKGTMTYTSESGKGTTFRLTLPIYSTEPA